jgi:hypothetical protein
MGTTVRNETLIREEIKRRLNSANVSYHSVQSADVKIRIYCAIILSLVMSGCETRFLILREEHELRMFENRALRRVFGPKIDEVTEEWRKVHNEELRNLYVLFAKCIVIG